MIRKIISIDEEKCDGCGLCVTACHEGAIAMAEGKARLLRDDYCDGLGDCLPACPAGAISFVQREAAPYDEAAVQAHLAQKKTPNPAPCQCPGAQARELHPAPARQEPGLSPAATHLRQWPVQIQLAPVQAPYFAGAHLLIAADCAAYAYGDFHREFMKGKVTLIGCPKLDAVEYAEKLAAILQHNDIHSVTVVRMSVPCCGGIARAAEQALQSSGKGIPWQTVTLSTNGQVLG